MSFAEDYMQDYRVKFVDVRVNPPGGRRRSGAGRTVRACEYKGCDAPGSCKAPKPFSARTSQIPGQPETDGDFHWFCQRHAAEYNHSYDFFEGMTEAEVTAFQASAAYGHKRTWRFGGGPVGGKKAGTAHNPRSWRGAKDWLYNGAAGASGSAAAPRDRTRLQIRALEELELPPDAKSDAIRERYGLLVKRFHPDSNGGDRSTEHRLSVVIKAFKALKASGLA
jgi:hypothetical protein